ncbi:MAG: flagellar hook-associated protein FlgK [Pseudomonadota bacterium]
MALSSALNNAVSGLSVNARMAQTTSNNLANVQTSGYARREVALSSGALGGVQAHGIVRDMSAGLIADRRAADADVGREQPGAMALAQLEQTFGPVGDAGGIAGRLSALEQALISAGGDPASDVRLRGVVNRLGDVVTAIRSDADALQSQRQAADRAIAQDVETLNTSLQQIYELNGDIGRMRNAGQDPSSLIDARQVVVDKIASITPVRQIERDDDRIALYSMNGEALIDGTPTEFGFDATPTIVPAMSFAGGALQGLTRNGQPIDVNNGFGRLLGGSLEANFILRDQILPDIQTNLDNLAADLVRRFEDPGVDPTLAAGDPGLLTDRGGALDPLDLTGVSLRLEVNPAVDPDQGGALSNLRDGVNAVVAGPVGDGTQLDRWLAALRSTTSVATGGANQSAAGHAADFIADVAERRLYTEENLTFAQSRQDRLLTAELANGVDTDQELQDLLRIEQAYAANVRVFQTVDQMMRALMEI